MRFTKDGVTEQLRKGLILDRKPMGGKEPQILSKEELQRYEIDWDKKTVAIKERP